MGKYPIFLELSGRRAVVIGAGAVAVRKAQSLLAAGARLVVVGRKISEAMSALGAGDDVELIESRYSKDYLPGAVLVIAATNNPELNKRIYKDCQQLEILCNVVDQPGLCDFFVPAVVKRGDLQIAIGTDGTCPAYAGHLRKKLEEIFSDEHGRFLAELEAIRKDICEAVPNQGQRKALLGQLAGDESFDYFIENGPAAWHRYARKLATEATGNKSPATG